MVVVVTGLWATSFLVDIFRTDYSPPPSVQSAFLAVLGVAFGTGLIKGAGNGRT